MTVAPAGAGWMPGPVKMHPVDTEKPCAAGASGVSPKPAGIRGEAGTEGAFLWAPATAIEATGKQLPNKLDTLSIRPEFYNGGAASSQKGFPIRVKVRGISVRTNDRQTERG